MAFLDPSNLQAWLHHWGYLALFAGTVFEGETVMLLGGAAARHGDLSWPIVVGVAALGGFAGDAALFALGRWQGRAWFDRQPWLARPLARVDAAIARHPALAVIGVRFAYGLRLLGPCVIGTRGLPWRRFAAANALGALLWALAWVGAGGLAGRLALPPAATGGWILVPAIAILAGWLWHRPARPEPAVTAPRRPAQD